MKFGSVGIALVSTLMILFGSCTEVNDNLGVGILPSDQRFEVRFATLEEGIESYLTYTDSLSTGSLDYAYFGALTSEAYGAKTRATSIFQFDFSVRTDTIVHEDREAAPDSMALVVGMKTLGGDTLKQQSFDVYRVRKLLERDSLYYNGGNYREYVDPQPMFTFSYEGKPNGAKSFDTLSLRVANKALAEEFMNELWADTASYRTDSLFFEKFSGLCITPSETSPEDAAIYGINLQWDSEEGPQSYLILYGHDYPKGDSPELVEDSIMRAFTISNDANYTKMRAVTFVDHNYEATDFADKINYNVTRDEPLTNPVSVGYIEGVLGVTTTIELCDEFVAALRALQPEGRTIFINQARLTVDLASDDYTYYDYAPSRVGMYVDYPSLENIADYAYLYETNYDIELLYGGYLNRTKGCYTMDISMHLQQLLQDENNEMSRRVTFAFGAYELMNEGIVALSTTGIENPILIELTYTIIGE